MAANTHLTEDPEARIQYYLEDGWQGDGWSPYELLVIGEGIFATQPTNRGHIHPDGPQNAEEYRQVVLDKARRRWMQGFYADPFTKTPRRRPTATNYRRAA